MQGDVCPAGYMLKSEDSNVLIRHFLDYSLVPADIKIKIPDKLYAYHRFVHNEAKRRLSFLTGRSPYCSEGIPKINQKVISQDPNTKKFDNLFILNNPRAFAGMNLKTYDAILSPSEEGIEVSSNSKSTLDKIEKILGNSMNLVMWSAIGLGLYVSYTIYKDAKTVRKKTEALKKVKGE